MCPKSPVHTYNASTQAPPTTSKLASTNAMLLSVGDDQKGRGRKTYRFVPKNVCDRFMGKERNHYLAVLVFFEVHLPFFWSTGKSQDSRHELQNNHHWTRRCAAVCCGVEKKNDPAIVHVLLVEESYIINQVFDFWRAQQPFCILHPDFFLRW